MEKFVVLTLAAVYFILFFVTLIVILVAFVKQYLRYQSLPPSERGYKPKLWGRDPYDLAAFISS